MRRRLLCPAVAVLLAGSALLVAFEANWIPWPWPSGLKAKANPVL